MMSVRSRMIDFPLLSVGFVSAGLYIAHNARTAAWPLDRVWEELLIYVPIATGLTVLLNHGVAYLRGTDKATPTKHLIPVPLAGLLIILSISLPGNIEAHQRSQVTSCNGRMRVIAASLLNHAKVHGHLPESLEALFSEDEIVDPYSPGANPFGWSLTYARGGQLLSVGPDRVLDSTEPERPLKYSPTNGAFSKGDIVRTVAVE